MNQAILEQKKQVVSDLTEKLKNSASVVVAEYRGLNVAETTELRRTLRAENVHMGVYKNSLVARAAEALGYNDLAEKMTGPNALVFSEDAVAPARILAKFAKKHKNLVLKTGLVDGKVVDEAGLKELSSLPNKEGMIAMFAGCLNYPVGAFARALKAVADARDGGAAATEEAAA
jgi:large subunit ribosomal protein L10